jgi:hypothetical protein
LQSSNPVPRTSTTAKIAAPLPIRYRLDDFELSHSERALLRAMFKFTRGGIMFYASFKKVGRLAGLSPKTVKRLINGYVDKRNGRRRRGFLERGILTRRDDKSKKTGTYQINEDALIPLPRILEAVQQELPGVIPEPKVGPPQQTISDEAPRPVRLGDTVSSRLGDTVSSHLGDTVSPDFRFIENPLEREIQRQQPPLSLSLDQEGENQRDLEWAKRFARR